MGLALLSPHNTFYLTNRDIIPFQLLVHCSKTYFQAMSTRMSLYRAEYPVICSLSFLSIRSNFHTDLERSSFLHRTTQKQPRSHGFSLEDEREKPWERGWHRKTIVALAFNQVQGRDQYEANKGSCLSYFFVQFCCHGFLFKGAIKHCCILFLALPGSVSLKALGFGLFRLKLHIYHISCSFFQKVIFTYFYSQHSMTTERKQAA